MVSFMKILVTVSGVVGMVSGESPLPNECGKFAPLNKVEGRVIGGRDGMIEQFPWQASLQRFRLFPLFVPDWAHTCGASIINSEWLLTAAHCVDG